METIGNSEIWSFLSDGGSATAVVNSEVRKDSGRYVRKFLDLANKIAELQFRNLNHVLVFRGQSTDYLNQGRYTSLKPSIFRPEQGIPGNPDENIIKRRFDKLKQAEILLVNKFYQMECLGRERVGRHRILRWSIIQHYEICPTPLLDVSHSLRVAASFASLPGKNEAFLYVLGVPNLSGSVTASAEAGIQIVRLASVCPPNAMRPHIQEGYLLGEYPEMESYDQKALYRHSEIDFGHRLVAKFRFNPHEFWQRDAFPKVGEAALYPNAHDPLMEIAEAIKLELAAGH